MRPQIPRKVRTGGRIVRVGWFGAEQDPDDLCPISCRSVPGRWGLLMVLPETGPAQAAAPITTTSKAGNHQSVSALRASDSNLPSNSFDPSEPAATVTARPSSRIIR